MKLIVGLGNPGEKYVGTRHNMGFIVLDEWAYQHQESFNRQAFEGRYFETRIRNEKVIFLKPETYMNDSGRSVAGFYNYYHLQPEDLIVIYDDMDMEPGHIRLRHKGSAGGHNGMKSIIKAISTSEFARIRVGIGHPNQQSVIQHVLGHFPKEQNDLMLTSVKNAVNALDYYLDGNSFENTMNRFNA